MQPLLYGVIVALSLLAGACGTTLSGTTLDPQNPGQSTAAFVVGLRAAAGGGGLTFSLVVDVQDLQADAHGPLFWQRPGRLSLFEAPAPVTLFELKSASASADARQDARSPSRALQAGTNGDEGLSLPAPVLGSRSEGNPNSRISLAGEPDIIMR